MISIDPAISEPFPSRSRWNPLTTTGAEFYLHVAVAAAWITALLLRLGPR
jgi:hypothetical protein